MIIWLSQGHVFSWFLKYKKKKRDVGIKKHSKKTRDNIKYPENWNYYKIVKCKIKTFIKEC